MTPAPARTIALVLTAAVLGTLTGAARQPAAGQDVPLRLQGVNPGGLRTSVTEARGTLSFTVVNPGPEGRDARVVVFYPARPEVQYARDVWVPGGAAVSDWLPVGPAPAAPGTVSREVQALLYDRTGGGDRLVLPPGEERVRSRVVLYRRRVPTTAVLVDDPPEDDDAPATDPAVLLAHTLRSAGGYPEHVSVVRDAFLPPAADAFDGVDHVVLAGNRLAADPVGRAHLRRWVQQGGRLWVMLDLVDPGTVAPVLGDDFDLHVIDRVGLTTVRLYRAVDDPATAPARDLEQPVELVRVALSGGEHVLHTVNGWPASFTRPLGRGKVLFTTLGGPGWYRPRTNRDPKSPYPNTTGLPIPLAPLDALASELLRRDDPHPFTADDLRPLLTEEIGYAVLDRGTAAVVFGGFVLALAGVGFGLRRSRRPELAGWLGPAAAVAAAGVFVGLGEAGRRAVPPTTAATAVVHAVPATGEAAAEGLFAVYRPDSGPVPVGTTGGGWLDLDTGGLEGQTRRRVQTDLDAWHWDGLALPAGVRTGPFRTTLRNGPVTAVARFGPGGVEGTLTAPGFRDPGDALVATPAGWPAAVRLDPGGAFAVTDPLSVGQFLGGTVLTDRQQRRQAVYRKLLTGPPPPHLEGREFILAWAEPDDLPFTAGDKARVIQNALLVVPLVFDRTPPDTPVAVPRAFVPFRRVLDGRPQQPTLESAYPIDMRLRFQLPAAVLPLRVERAVLHLTIRAPARRVAVAGVAAGRPVPLFAADAPAGPVRVEVTDGRLLTPDPDGGLLLDVAVTGGAGTDTAWVIESIGLDVTGRTAK